MDEGRGERIMYIPILEQWDNTNISNIGKIKNQNGLREFSPWYFNSHSIFNRPEQLKVS